MSRGSARSELVGFEHSRLALLADLEKCLLRISLRGRLRRVYEQAHRPQNALHRSAPLLYQQISLALLPLLDQLRFLYESVEYPNRVKLRSRLLGPGDPLPWNLVDLRSCCERERSRR